MRRLGALAVAVAVTVSLTGMTPARGGRHCAARLVSTGPERGTHGAGVALEELGCYASFSAAIAEGSNGAIRLPGGSTPASVTQAIIDAATTSPESSVLIGTEYTLTSYIGSSKSYFASVTCSASVTWEVSYVTDAWNDDFESGKGFGGCDTNKKFSASNFGGSVLTCTPNCADYGSLRNLVSSLRWKD